MDSSREEYAFGSGMQFGAVGVGIEKPKDLEGKIVGTALGSGPEFYLRLYIEHYGLSENKITIKNVPFPDLTAALARGDIDAFFALFREDVDNASHCIGAIEAAR